MRKIMLFIILSLLVTAICNCSSSSEDSITSTTLRWTRADGDAATFTSIMWVSDDATNQEWSGSFANGDTTTAMTVTKITGSGVALGSDGTIYTLVTGDTETVILTPKSANTLTITAIAVTTPTFLKWTRDDGNIATFEEIRWVSEGVTNQTWTGAYNTGDSTPLKTVTKLSGIGEGLTSDGTVYTLFTDSGSAVTLIPAVENTVTITEVKSTTLRWTNNLASTISSIRWVAEGTTDQTWPGAYTAASTTPYKAVIKFTGTGEAFDDGGSPVILLISGSSSVQLTEFAENTLTVTGTQAK